VRYNLEVFARIGSGLASGCWDSVGKVFGRRSDLSRTVHKGSAPLSYHAR
jgi:hypothetical protein